MPSHADADKEGDRRRERASQQDVIPHIVLNVTERDDQETKELLKGSALPPLEQVDLTLSTIFFDHLIFLSFLICFSFSPFVVVYVGVG